MKNWNFRISECCFTELSWSCLLKDKSGRTFQIRCGFFCKDQEVEINDLALFEPTMRFRFNSWTFKDNYSWKFRVSLKLNLLRQNFKLNWECRRNAAESVPGDVAKGEEICSYPFSLNFFNTLPVRFRASENTQKRIFQIIVSWENGPERGKKSKNAATNTKPSGSKWFLSRKVIKRTNNFEDFYFFLVISTISGKISYAARTLIASNFNSAASISQACLNSFIYEDWIRE